MSELLVPVLLSAAITYALRGLPFAVFGGGRPMPRRLTRLGGLLPSAIMAVLIVYCMKDVATDFSGTGVFQVLAGAVVVVSYKLRRSTFLSMVLGTAVYMLLLRL